MRVEDYLDNGRVKRSSIALHIKLNKISHSELETLINDPRINRGFIGDKFQNKKLQEEWNQEYLDSLVYEAVAGTFNADYLRYLFEVAQSVKPQTSGDSRRTGTNSIERTREKAGKGVLYAAQKGLNVVKGAFKHR